MNLLIVHKERKSKKCIARAFLDGEKSGIRIQNVEAHMQFLNDHNKLQVRIMENKERKEIGFRFFQGKQPIQIAFERGEIVKGEQDLALLRFSPTDRNMVNNWSLLLERLGKCIAKKLKVKYNMKAAFVPQMLHRIYGPHSSNGEFHLHTQVLRSFSATLLKAPISNVVLNLDEIVCDEDKSVWMRFNEVYGVTVKEGGNDKENESDGKESEIEDKPQSPVHEALAEKKREDQKDEELSLKCMLTREQQQKQEQAQENEVKYTDTESMDGGDAQGINELDYDNYMSFMEESNSVIEQAKKEITRREQELHHLKRATVKFIKSCNAYQMGEPNEEYKKQMARLQNWTMKKE